MTHTMSRTLMVAALVLALAGCSKNESKTPAKGGEATPKTVTPAPAAGTGAVTGTVLETMEAASYTYILIDTGASKVWAAGPRATIAVGDKVSIADAMEMKDFQSKSLNRKFDTILFAASISRDGEQAAPTGTMPAGHPSVGGQGKAAAMPEGHPPIGGAAAPQAAEGDMPKGDTPPGSKKVKPAAQEISDVPKAEGENGYTVAELHAQAKTLAGKRVRVRGVVVKASSSPIMGRYWVHVQDGSGDSSDGSHDLTFTGEAPAKPGTTVLVEGTVAADKDFGAGYRYHVILEQAKVE